MPVDGTYGRLSAHNQRFKELRRKKLERRENKVWQNSLKNTHKGKAGAESNPETIDPKKLELIKSEIRKKAKAELQKEFYIYVVSFLVVCILVYFLFFN